MNQRKDDEAGYQAPDLKDEPQVDPHATVAKGFGFSANASLSHDVAGGAGIGSIGLPIGHGVAGGVSQLPDGQQLGFSSQIIDHSPESTIAGGMQGGTWNTGAAPKADMRGVQYPGLQSDFEKVAQQIGYPEMWDTAAYPTLAEALIEATHGYKEKQAADESDTSEPGFNLSFNALDRGNMMRLPTFKNSKGGYAHAQTDGSDWSPAQWLQAVIGELGEFATVRLEYEAGRLLFKEYEEKARKELADVQTYLSLLSIRALDQHSGEEPDAAVELMQLMSYVGEYANFRKKLERGDHTVDELQGPVSKLFIQMREQLHALRMNCLDPRTVPSLSAHPGGVNLGRATFDKFNEVSKRVGSPVFLELDDKGNAFPVVAK